MGIDFLVGIADGIGFVGLDAVQVCLVEKQLLQRQLLWDDAISILDGLPIHFVADARFFHIA